PQVLRPLRCWPPARPPPSAPRRDRARRPASTSARRSTRRGRPPSSARRWASSLSTAVGTGSGAPSSRSRPSAARARPSCGSPPVCVGRTIATPGSGLSYRELVLAAHPVAFWPFAADAGDAAGTHPLTLAGGAAVAGHGIEGAGDRALALSGHGQYASSPYSP